MPFINLKSTKAVTPQQEAALKSDFGRICDIIGKSERWVMIGFEDNCRLWFGGTNDDCAYIEVNLFSSASSGYDAMTAELTKTVSDTLGIPANRIYVKYSETPFWGWSGSNF